MSFRLARSPALAIARQAALKRTWAAAARPSTTSFVRFNSTQQSKDQSKEEPKAAPILEKEPAGSNALTIALIATAIGATGYYFYQKTNIVPVKTLTADTATFEDYQKIYNQIATKIVDVDDEPEEGSYGPALVRLAWHASGTYDKSKNDGGSYKGTMQFKTEASHGANNGLDRARNFLDSILDANKWLSHGDLYTLSGVAAVQEMGGPTIKWKAGRVDGVEADTASDGRLPDASQGQKHIRDIFGRMGFNDGEMVALIGAHCLGRCHVNYSGYDGPWTFSPTVFTNDFYKLLVDEKWHVRKWEGPKQYQDDKTNSLMMLPADYALVQDKEFKKWVHKFAEDNDLFFSEFAKAFSTLLELGCAFKSSTPTFEFKRLDDQ